MSGQLSWPEESGKAPGTGERPKHVKASILLTYLGSAMSVVLAIGAFLTYDQFTKTPLSERREQARRALEQSQQPAGREDVDQYLGLVGNSYIGIGIFLLVAGAVWILIGVMVGRAKSWTRLTASALAFFNLPFVFITGQMTTYIGIASVVVGIVTAGLLWTTPSREWLGATGPRV